MVWKKERIYFADLALMVVIDYINKEYGEPPLKKELWQSDGNGSWNWWLESSGAIALGYAQRITASSRVGVAISTLRELELLDPDAFHYVPTSKWKWLLEKLGDNWHKWPVEIPIEDGQLNLEKAVYLDDREQEMYNDN